MATRLRRRIVPLAAVALLAAGCTDDEHDSGVDGATAATAPVDADSSSDSRDDPDDDTDDGVPSEPERGPFAGLEHSATDPVVEFCAALATRNVSTVVGLMADDAIATDHATGVVYRGRDEIRAWLANDPGFALFERTECAPADQAIASHFWSATTYRFHSDTQPGGTEGVIVVGAIGGAIDRLELLYRPVTAETGVAEPVSDADGAVLGAWCESWSTFDVDRVLGLVTDDVRFTPNAMAADNSFRPPPGADAIRGAMIVVSGGPVDRAECSGGGQVANGGWIAAENRFDDDASDMSFGGVVAMQLRDGKISTAAPFMDTMTGGILVFDTTQPAPPRDPTPAHMSANVLVALETSGWWDYASGFLGADLTPSEVRQDVAADVAEVCAFLGTNPPNFADVLDELDRVAAGRAPGLDLGDGSAYSLVLDTAISSACPVEAALVDALRPRTDPPSEIPDVVARIVPDPRPGDLRTDPNADVLPEDYVAPPPFWTVPLAYGDDPAQQLDLHLPVPRQVPERDAVPTIVFVHAGGWESGDRGRVPAMVLRFVELGYAVASVGYRLAPEHTFPAQIADVKGAIRWLKAYLARDGMIDADRIVLVGSSAGGHIAALVAATPGRFEPADLTAEQASVDSSVAGVVSSVGPTDLVSFYRQSSWARKLAGQLLGCDPCSDERLAEASPTSYLTPELPPAYWAYGRLDESFVEPTSQGAAIASAWAEHVGSGSSWFDLVDDQGHNLAHWSINQSALEEFVASAVERP